MISTNTSQISEDEPITAVSRLQATHAPMLRAEDRQVDVEIAE